MREYEFYYKIMRLEYFLQVFASCTLKTNKLTALLLLPACHSLFSVWGSAVVEGTQFHSAVARCDSPKLEWWHFLSLCSCVLVDQVGKDLSQGREGSTPCHLSLNSLWHETGSDGDSVGTSALSQWSWIIPSHCQNAFYSYSCPEQCLSYPSMFLSLWSLWLAVACSDLWIHLAPKNEVCYLQNRQTQQQRDKFPKLAQCCDSDKLGYQEDLSWNKSQWVFQVYSEQGRVLEDATSRSRS